MYHTLTEELFSDHVIMCYFSENDKVLWERLWRSFLKYVMLQSLQTVLMSIEERLRALDTLYSPRFIPRWEVNIEQQSRRMETIESRLGRLETLLQLRLDKLSEVIWLFYYVREKENRWGCQRIGYWEYLAELHNKQGWFPHTSRSPPRNFEKDDNKHQNKIILNSNTRDRFLRSAENRKVSRLCPTQTLCCGLITVRATGGTDSELGRWPGLQWSFKEDLIYPFTFPNVSNAGVLITIFTYPLSKPYLWIF